MVICIKHQKRWISRTLITMMLMSMVLLNVLSIQAYAAVVGSDDEGNIVVTDIPMVFSIISLK